MHVTLVATVFVRRIVWRIVALANVWLIASLFRLSLLLAPEPYKARVDNLWEDLGSRLRSAHPVQREGIWTAPLLPSDTLGLSDNEYLVKRIDSQYVILRAYG